MPESVTVWVVYPSIAGMHLSADGQATLFLYRDLMRDLHRGGFPNPVALGAVSEEILAAAGGEDAYLGARGELRVPQLTSDAMPREWYDTFPPPKLREEK